jgi:hypothetical protein
VPVCDAECGRTLCETLKRSSFGTIGRAPQKSVGARFSAVFIRVGDSKQPIHVADTDGDQ